MRTLVRAMSLVSILVGVLVLPAPSLAATGRASPAVTAAACRAGASACPIRITFAPGAYSAQAKSTLSGHSNSKWFVVRARAGQSLIVIVEGAGATQGTVYFPNGQHAGQPGGRILDQPLTISGNYRIKVSESATAQGWSGPVTVLVVAY